MRAGTVTLRVQDRLVGIRVDTDDTRRRVLERFDRWIDDHDVPWVFDLTLDPRSAPSENEPGGARRGPVPLPQLRFGQRVVARSRRPDDVVDALAAVLGGYDAARREPDHGWSGMRLFTRADEAVLLDVQAPTLLGDRALQRAGIIEHSAWGVVVHRGPDGTPTVALPPPLAPPANGSDAGARSFRLVGIVSPGGPINGERRDDESAATTLARLATRQTSAEWFTIVNDLRDRGQISTADHRLSDLRTSLEDLFALA